MIKRQARLLATIVVLVLSLSAFADTPLTPHVAEYKVKISVLGGSLKTRLDATANGYFAESTVSPTGFARLLSRGSIQESSEFTVDDSGVRPWQYVATDTITSKGQDIDMHFDWDSQSIDGAVDNEPFTIEIVDGVLDRMSVQYALMYDLLNDNLRDTYLLQESDDIRTLNITNVGTKQVQVPFGNFEAVGIQHQTGKSSRTTTLWCVKELGYLPVIIEQYRKGKIKGKVVLATYVTASHSDHLVDN